MARFISTPALEIDERPEQWRLHDECIYQSDLLGDDGKPVLVTVPVGFLTDLSSIPRIFRFFIIKNGKHRAAAIVHDYLCRLGLAFSRTLADKIFLEAMLVAGERKIRSRLMYWAVAINTKRMKLMGKAR